MTRRRKGCKIPTLTIERYVKVELDGVVSHYRPVDEDDKLDARPKTYAQSFAEASCTRVLQCKKLDDRQLEHCLKIGALGHRMQLLEQFRFL